MKNKLKIIIPIAVAVIAIIVAALCIDFTPAERVDIPSLVSTAQKYLIENNYEQAIAEFNKIIEIDPMNVDAYIGIADAYIGMGDTEKAIEWLEKGYELTGDERLSVNFLKDESNNSVTFNNLQDENKKGLVENTLPEDVYDDKGRIVKKYIIENSKVLEMIQYFYKSSNDGIIERHYIYAHDTWQGEDDPNDFIVTQAIEYINTTEIFEITTFYSNGKRNEVTKFSNGEKVRYDKFDENEHTIYTAQYRNDSWTEYIYDIDNDKYITKSYSEDVLIRFSEKFISTNIDILYEIYRPNGKLERKTYYYENGNIFESYSYYEDETLSGYTLRNENGYLIRDEAYPKESEAWFRIFEYHNNTDKIKKISTYHIDENTKNEYLSFEEYMDIEGVTIKKVKYYKNSNIIEAEELRKNVDGKAVTEKVIFYDKDGEISRKVDYDKNGRKIH